jgi:heat shock protein HslJ
MLLKRETILNRDNMKKIFKTAMAVVAGSMLLAACASQKTEMSATEKAKFYGEKWKVASIRGEQMNYVGEGAYISFNEENQQINANAGCNILNAPYKVEGFALTISDGALTRMMCPDAASEAKFLEAIQSVKSFKITGDTLELLNENAESQLVLVASKNDSADAAQKEGMSAEEKEKFYGEKWNVVSIRGEKAEYVETGAYITFNEANQQINANAGCNILNAPFKLDGFSLSFSDGAMTQMMCPNDELERKFMEAFPTVKTFKISGDTLEMFNENAESLFTLVAAEKN